MNPLSMSGALSAMQNKMNNSTALPVPTGGMSVARGNPGFMSTPFIPTKTLNSNAPGSLSGSMNTPAPTPQTGGPTLNSNPFGSPNSGIIGAINSATGISPKSSPAIPSNTPTAGLSDVGYNASNGYGTSTPATISTTNNSGGSSSTISPTVSGSSGLPIIPAPNPTTVPTTSSGTPAVGTPTQNAQNVLNTSGGDTAGQGAANASALYGILGNEAKLAPFSNGTTQSLDQSYANLTRPQSTGNLAGEEGLFNTQDAIFQNAANTSAAQAIANKGIATQGAETVLNSSLPTQVSPGNTLVNPITSTPTYGLGTGTGGNGADAYQNFSNLQFNTSTGQTLSKQANDLSTAADQTDQNFQTLSKAETLGGLNASDYPSWNAFTQKVGAESGGAGNVAALNEAVNAAQTSLSSIISSGTSGLTPSAITALTKNQAINTLSPSELQTLWDTVKTTMATKINTTRQQAIDSEKAGTNFNNGSSVNNSGSGLSDWNFSE